MSRICYGIELEPKYVDTVIQRWQFLTKKDAMLENGRSYNQLKDMLKNDKR
jgi:DNA modification methylase